MQINFGNSLSGTSIVDRDSGASRPNKINDTLYNDTIVEKGDSNYSKESNPRYYQKVE